MVDRIGGLKNGFAFFYGTNSDDWFLRAESYHKF